MSDTPVWRRVTLRARCPICGGPNDCTIAPDRTGIKCSRSISGNPIVQADGRTCWYHKMPANAAPAIRSTQPTQQPAQLSKSQIAAMLKTHRQALTEQRMQSLTESLGVSELALRRYDVGFDPVTCCYSFPMRDEHRQIVGFRLRSITGKKYAVLGSRSGLFMPADFDPTELIPFEVDPDPAVVEDRGAPIVLMPEGPTDAAAAAQLGFRSIGRPCCNGGGPMIARMLHERISKHRRHHVVVFADRDQTHYRPDGTPFWPGLEGGLSLAAMLLPICWQVQFLMCPDGAKDLRDWVGRGNGPAHLLAHMMEAPNVTPGWLENEYDVLEFKRITEARQAEESNAA